MAPLRSHGSQEGEEGQGAEGCQGPNNAQQVSREEGTKGSFVKARGGCSRPCQCQLVARYGRVAEQAGGPGLEGPLVFTKFRGFLWGSGAVTIQDCIKVA